MEADKKTQGQKRRNNVNKAGETSCERLHRRLMKESRDKGRSETQKGKGER